MQKSSLLYFHPHKIKLPPLPKMTPKNNPFKKIEIEVSTFPRAAYPIKFYLEKPFFMILINLSRNQKRLLVEEKPF